MIFHSYVNLPEGNVYVILCHTWHVYIYIWVRCTFRAPRVLWLGLVIVIMIVYLNGKRTETMCMSVCGVSWYGVSCVCFTIRLLVSICFHITDASTQHVYKHTFVHKPYCFRYKPNKKTNKHFRISLRTIFLFFFVCVFVLYIRRNLPDNRRYLLDDMRYLLDDRRYLLDDRRHL